MMGQITTKLLDIIGITWEFLSNNMVEAEKQLERANKYIENSKSFFFVVKKNTFAPGDPIHKSPFAKASGDTARLDALKTINSCKDENTIILATTGVTGRELYEIEDAQNNFYMVGSMGCVGSIALGLVLGQNKSVIAIDGDGALLMRLGSLATNAAHTQNNMLHILLDNNAHDSTGGQATVSSQVDFVAIAKAAGYPCTYRANNLEEFKQHIEEYKKHKKLTFLYLQIVRGKKPGLGRPKVTPEQVKKRLIKFIKN
jgi:phosphonopyruvate decarboxylase